MVEMEMLKRLDVDVSNVSEACCVLHNICEVHREEFSEEWLKGIESQESECSSGTMAHLSMHKRYFQVTLYCTLAVST